MTDIRLAVDARRHIFTKPVCWYDEFDGGEPACWIELYVGIYRVAQWSIDPSADQLEPEELLEWTRAFAAEKIKTLFTAEAEASFGPRAEWAAELEAIQAIGDPELAAAGVVPHPRWVDEMKWRQAQARTATHNKAASNPNQVTSEFRPEAPQTRRCALYWHYDADGILLYVGISEWLEVRDEQHVAKSVWAEFVATTSTQWVDARKDALKLEEKAIKEHAPIFNKRHAPPGREERIRSYLAKRGRLDLLSKALS